MMVHIDTCAQKEKVPCSANASLHGEPTDAHWWSGWPGAFCLKCGDEDKDEVCMGGCACSCHDEFWKSYEDEFLKEYEKHNWNMKNTMENAMEAKLETITITARFSFDIPQERAEEIIRDSCPHAKFYQFQQKEVGCQRFCQVIAEVCMEHLDKMRGDERIVYWEQIKDYHPMKNCSTHSGSC